VIFLYGSVLYIFIDYIDTFVIGRIELVKESLLAQQMVLVCLG